MIIDILLLMLAALAAVFLPLVSLFSWSGLLLYISRYARESFSVQVLWRAKDTVLRYSSYAITPIVFILSGVVAATFSVVFEFLVVIFVFLPGFSEVIIQMVSLISAGPIEETGKLLVAIGLYLILILMGKKIRETSEVSGKNRVKDGMIIGLFVGASFGFIESLMYMLYGFISLRQEGFSFFTIDPLVWRFVLGVSIHAVFTAIACVGLGQKGMTRKILYTISALGIAATVHALNNGVEGYITLVLEYDTLASVLLVDAIQISLVIFDFIILIIFWNILSRNSS